MKINTIKREEGRPINQNLSWFDSDILPKKPDNVPAHVRFRTYPVIVDYKYTDGTVTDVLDYCDFDFEKSRWKIEEPHKIKQWFPLPSKRKVIRSNKNRTHVRKIS